MHVHDEIKTLPLAVELPDRVPDIDYMVAAFHELGHALAFDDGGFRVDGLWLEQSWWSGELRGAYTAVESEPDDEDEDTDMDRYLVGILAGGEAAAHCLQYYLDVSWDYAYYVAYEGSITDHGEFRRLKRHARKSTRRLQRDTERFVRKNWRRIDKQAPKFVRKRSLTGSAL